MNKGLRRFAFLQQGRLRTGIDCGASADLKYMFGSCAHGPAIGARHVSPSLIVRSYDYRIKPQPAGNQSTQPTRRHLINIQVLLKLYYGGRLG